MSGPRLTILVVEDNGALRRLMARVLSDQGFEVLQASTAIKGLELFQAQSESVALAVVDMVMPGMSGLDLAAELERLRPGIKILYTSGYGSSVAMESISRRSPDRVLLKPFDAAELVERVSRLVGLESPAVASEPASTTVPLAWDRLVEASDPIEAVAAELLGYRDTIAAFAIAAAHSAALRAAGLKYAFRPHDGSEFPMTLVVATPDAQRARDLIGSVGLGADVAEPAPPLRQLGN
jgi:CheY-like chemotaxis protein